MKLAALFLMLAIPAAGVAAQDSAPDVAKRKKLTLDTSVQELVADPAGKAVLDRDLPGITDHPQYEMFKSLSLKQLQTYSPDKLTPEVLAKVGTDLAAIR